jgi:endoglucanase
MRFSLLFFCGIFFLKSAFAQSAQDVIRINQSGYYSKAPKLAVVIGDYTSDEYAGENFGFYVLKYNSGDTAFKGSFGKLRQSTNSSLKTRIADFSALQKNGTYILFVPGIGNSYPFEIGNNIHQKAAKAVLKGFYFIRSSIPLEAKYAGKWARPAGHPDTKVLVHPSATSDKRHAGTAISSPGGW